MSYNRTELETGIERYRELIQNDPALKVEFEGSLVQFFQGGLPAVESPLEALSSSRRHLEWFLFERHSPTLRNRPAEALLEAWQESLSHRDPRLQASLLDSFSGLFEVVDKLDDDTARVADISGLANYDITVPPGLFEVGDLVVGRLYPGNDGAYFPSSVCAPIRDARLLAAVKRDVELIRDARERKVFRIAQAELESMFFTPFSKSVADSAPATAVDPALVIGAAREWLASGGLDHESVEAILQDLRDHPPIPGNIHPGSGDIVGHWLEELAFSTPLALDETRSRLLVAWAAMHAEDAPTGVVASDEFEHHQEPVEDGDANVDVAQAMAEFERDCASGRAVSDALADLERRLALDADEEDDVGSAPDFPGVVGAMVEEFLWEEESQFGTASIEGFAVLHAFSTYAQHIGVFEELKRKDVADFATRWLPEHPEACEPARIPVLLKALGKFCTWSFETHGALALADSNALIEDLGDSLQRIMSVNATRGEHNTGQLFQIRARDDSHYQVANIEREDDERVIPSDDLSSLSEGDYVRLRDEAGKLVPVRAYPPQLGVLLADLADA